MIRTDGFFPGRARLAAQRAAEQSRDVENHPRSAALAAAERLVGALRALLPEVRA